MTMKTTFQDIEVLQTPGMICTLFSTPMGIYNFYGVAGLMKSTKHYMNGNVFDYC